KPEDFSVLYQDTDAGPWDMGSSGSQTTLNNGRAVMYAATEVRELLIEAAAKELEAAAGHLELVEGSVRGKGSPTKAVSIASLAGSGAQFIGKGSGPVPEAPAVEGGRYCIGSL